MVAFVGPAVVRLFFPPQPVASTKATVTTVKSKYRFIGASKFSVSGEVLAGDKCSWRANPGKPAKCCVSNEQTNTDLDWGGLLEFWV
jgi:hypothetical protein